MLVSMSSEPLFLMDVILLQLLQVCEIDETASRRVYACVCVLWGEVLPVMLNNPPPALLFFSKPGSSGSSLEANFTQIHADQTLH